MRESVTPVRKMARPAWAGVPGSRQAQHCRAFTIHLRAFTGQPVTAAKVVLLTAWLSGAVPPGGAGGPV